MRGLMEGGRKKEQRSTGGGSFPLRFYIFPSSYFKRRFSLTLKAGSSLTLKTEVRFY